MADETRVEHSCPGCGSVATAPASTLVSCWECGGYVMRPVQRMAEIPHVLDDSEAW